MDELNCFPRVNFKCDSCGREFYHRNAYSVARNWREFEYYTTYCFVCVKESERQERRQAELWKPPKIDKRTLNKTGRTYQLGTRVRKDFLKKLKAIAKKQKLKYVEVLERALECYEREVSKTISP